MSIPASSQPSPSPERGEERFVETPLKARDVMESQPLQASGTEIGGGETTVVPGLGATVGTGGGTATTKGRLRDIWTNLVKNKKVVFGLAIIAFFVLVAIFGPVFVTQDPNAFSNDTLAAPSAAHWLGTTKTGQDVFVQLIDGTRVSILVGFATGIVVTIMSTVMGLLSGYFGGALGEVVSLVINIFIMLPVLPLSIVIAAFVSATYKGPWIVALVIAITSWAWGARVLRSQTQSMAHREFVEAARASGETTFRIIFFEILPNEFAIVAAGFVGTVIYIILAEAALEFLGLGDPIHTVSWGTMFYWAQNSDALLLGTWWWFVPPGICIALVGAALAFVNSGIDEFVNPKLRNEPRPKKTKSQVTELKTKEAVLS